MRAQLTRTDGHISSALHHYQEAGLFTDVSDPDTDWLINLIDPYEFRSDLTLPLLIMKGAHDPYWAIDSLSHFLSELKPYPALFVVPDAGHRVSKALPAQRCMETWFKLIRGRASLPSVRGRIAQDESAVNLTFHVPPQVKVAEVQWWDGIVQDRFQPSEYQPERLDAGHPFDSLDSGVAALVFQGASRGVDKQQRATFGTVVFSTMYGDLPLSTEIFLR
jgi:hypothetical protein